MNISFYFGIFSRASILFLAIGLSGKALAGYIITDLGTLGGGFSLGSSLNNHRQVVGSSQNLSGVTRAFIYTNSTMQDMGILSSVIPYDSAGSNAAGINAHGHVTGGSRLITGSPLKNVEHAFIFDGAVMHDIGTLGGDNSNGAAINDDGQIVGSSELSSGANHAFFYDQGVMTDLGTLGGTNSWGNDVNSHGVVVGSSQRSGDTVSRAFIYESVFGAMHDIGTLGGLNSIAYGINDSEQITGLSNTSLGETHAFIYHHGNMMDLGTLGGSFSSGEDINNNGFVVGESTFADGFSGAFLYDGNNMLDLCVLVDCVINGWDGLILASSINDFGDITGFGLIDGQTHAFLISEVPIPPAFILLLSGFLCLLSIANRASSKQLFLR